MLQAKFTVEEAQAQFLSNFKEYGFKDKSSMLRAAVEYFKKAVELDSHPPECCSPTTTVVNSSFNVHL